MISSKKYVDQTLKKYQLVANKALGQNFLIEEAIVDSIIKQSNITKNTYVMEIGPGLGALTEKLVQKAKFVKVFEIDQNMCMILKNTFKETKNLEICHVDFLKVDLSQEFFKLKDEQDIKIISNLPYYITTQILSKILFSNYSIHSLIVMMQKEVGMKLYRPQLKEKSPLTTILQYQYQVDIIQHVSKNAYLPRPEIDSMVLKITKRMPTIQAKDEKILFDIIKELFKNRRKTIANNLQSYFKKKEDVLTFLKDLSIAENKRIEQLSLSEIILIANHLGE